MRVRHRVASISTVLLGIFLLAPAWGGSLNKSIKIGDGETSGGASTVNGSVTVGSDAVVTGTVSTVNGTVRIGENARIEDAETVNGSLRVSDGVQSQDLSSVNGAIQVGTGVTVDGEISVVNGKIKLESGTTVSGEVSNVNGEIKLIGAEVRGSLSTVNGDVLLQDQATIIGDLTVERPSGWNNSNNSRKPKVVIGPGSRVGGSIILEQEVDLYISTSAEVGSVSGVMSIDDAERFSGKRP
jgi:DUF4097 and DUF4098 domain-containing protein YvlB